MGRLAGVFVGGESKRMGGRAKGLLRPPSGEASIVHRWIAMLHALRVPHVLIGRRAEYASLGEAIDDDPPKIGPIGGLNALVNHAKDGVVLALACDMPLVDEALVRRLIDAPPHAIVAPRREGRWEPLFARYDVPTMIRTLPERIARGDHRLQGLLDDNAVALATSASEDAQLADWDEPGDVR
jgi:molybdopterin-guanine dinucleotide biosynthesis protein A